MRFFQTFLSFRATLLYLIKSLTNFDLACESADPSTNTRSGDQAIPGRNLVDGSVEGHHDRPAGCRCGLWSVEDEGTILHWINKNTKILFNPVTLFLCNLNYLV